MADSKISGLPAVAAFAAALEFPVNDAGTSKKVTGSQMISVIGGAGGTLGYAQITANQATISTEVDITSLTVTVTVAAGRRIRVSCFTELFGTVAGDQSQVNIYQDGSIVMQSIMRHAATGRLCHPVSVVLTPSAGAHTYKLTALRASGTGTFTVNGSATAPAYVLAEDIGV